MLFSLSSNYDFRADGFKSSVTCNLGSTRNSAELRQKMALRYRKINELYSSYGDKLSGKWGNVQT